MLTLFTLFNLEGALRCECGYGGLAQLGERLPCKQEVSGSIPLISTIFNITEEPKTWANSSAG